MSMAVGGGGSVKAEPNVTPMIDVMLVLLIIFMIVVPALNAGFNAVPPEGQNITSHPEDDTDIVLGIDANGRYFLDKKAIQNERLEELLTTKYAQRTQDKIMYLKAHKDLEYGKVMDAIDIAAKAGVRVTGMITDQRAGTKSVIQSDLPAAMVKSGGKP